MLRDDSNPFGSGIDGLLLSRFNYALAGMLERKRDDRVRSVVLQMHTAIEDILNDLMKCRILGIPPDERHRKTRSKSARALHKLFVGGGSIGFERKLNSQLRLG